MFKKIDLQTIKSIIELNQQGISKSEIARTLGIDRKTVYNHLFEKFKIANRIRALKYKGLKITKWIKRKSYQSQVREDLNDKSYYDGLVKDEGFIPISQLYAHKMKKY